MPVTKDRYPGIREESAILLDDLSSAPTDPYTFAKINGVIQLIDDTGPYDPRGGGALPAATEVGQFLYSYDGATFEISKPVATDDGFVVTDEDGHIVVAA